jgi:hypothetical protein
MMSDAEATGPRVFPIPFKTITMSERRMMASQFGINWDALEVDLVDIPKPADVDNPTDAEKIAAAKVFSRIVGPNEKFALLYIAVKRQLPAASMAEIEQRADSGEWILSFNSDEENADEVAAVPLAPPNATTDTN